MKPEDITHVAKITAAFITKNLSEVLDKDKDTPGTKSLTLALYLITKLASFVRINNAFGDDKMSPNDIRDLMIQCMGAVDFDALVANENNQPEGVTS